LLEAASIGLGRPVEKPADVENGGRVVLLQGDP
jgi:hypothetical protein